MHRRLTSTTQYVFEFLTDNFAVVPLDFDVFFLLEIRSCAKTNSSKLIDSIKLCHSAIEARVVDAIIFLLIDAEMFDETLNFVLSFRDVQL